MTRRKIRRTTKPKIRYEDYQFLVQNRVRYYHKNTGLACIEIEELMSHANMVFCKAVADYNPELGTFSTYLWLRLKALLCPPKNLFSFFSVDVPTIGIVDPVCPFKLQDFHEMLSNLSAEAKGAITIIVNSDIRSCVNRRKYGKIADYLINEKDWEWSVAVKAVKEIKEGLQAL